MSPGSVAGHASRSRPPHPARPQASRAACPGPRALAALLGTQGWVLEVTARTWKRTPSVQPPQPRDARVGRASRTCPGAVVGDEAGHVHVPAVDGQVAHAAHELPAVHGEVFRQVGDAPQEQRARQIQGPGEAKPTCVTAWRGVTTGPPCGRRLARPLLPGTLAIANVDNRPGRRGGGWPAVGACRRRLLPAPPRAFRLPVPRFPHTCVRS